MTDDETYEPWAAVAFARRRWPIVVGIAVIAALSGLLVSSFQSDRYEATSTVLFRDPGLDQRIFDAPILFGGQGLLGGQNVSNGETSIGLVELTDVAEATATELDEPGLDGSDVADQITVRGGGSNELVEIIGKATDPDEAAALANAYAESFLAVRADADRAVYRRAFESVEDELDKLGPELADTAEAARLRRQLQQLQALQVIQTGDTELVQAASPPSERAAPKPLRVAGLAGAAGLLLGLIVALLLDRLDRRLSTRRELERAYRTRTIGTIPDLGQHDTQDATASFKALWTRLRFPAGHEGKAAAPKSLVVIAARRGEGATSVALGLADAAAETGLKVCLVEVDADDPGLAAAAAVPPSPGLSELLSGDAGEREVVRVPDRETTAGSVQLVPAGSGPVATSETTVQAITDLATGSDLLIVDAPALAESADAIPLLACGPIVLVAAPEQPAASADALMHELRDRDISIAGLVINRASGRAFELKPR